MDSSELDYEIEPNIAATGVEGIEVPISEEDIHQVESFLRSHRTKVYVCPGLVNLYFGSFEDMTNMTSWELHTTGIPAILWDAPQYNMTTKSQLRLCITEKGTGFILWQDCLSSASCYKAPDKCFHTMKVTTGGQVMAGLSFDDERAAGDLLRTINAMTSEIDLNAANANSKKKKKPRPPKAQKPPKKSDISIPCCFEHITKLESADRDHITTLATLVPEKKNGEKEFRTFTFSKLQ
ncbi:uncharacterized protein LOC144452814 [Glandiceps talaboti]